MSKERSAAFRWRTFVRHSSQRFMVAASGRPQSGAIPFGSLVPRDRRYPARDVEQREIDFLLGNAGAGD